MAKRPVQDDDEDDLPKVRKRRYKPPKKEDDDDDAPTGRRGGPQDDEDDEDDEDNISTGYMVLDITLDFVDDCIDWSKKHIVYAIIIGTILLLLISAVTAFIIYSCVHFFTRPSLAAVVQAYDQGLFPETKLMGDHALAYISSRRRPHHRTPFLFLQGAAICAIADREPLANQRDYYLMAANFLREAAVYNFLPDRAAEGWFFLGKSLFHIGELEQCRLPLRIAFEEGYPHTKDANWYLANAYFLGASPDLALARYYLQRYQAETTALEEEIAESRLLETMITLHLDGIEAAERVIAQIPRFHQFELMRNFVEGQIEFFKAREELRKAVALETDPNPNLIRGGSDVAVAPIAVDEEDFTALYPRLFEEGMPTPHSDSTAIAPAPVSPMDEETVQQFMRPAAPPAPVVGMFDDSSPIQQRIAELRPRYAEGVAVNNVANNNVADDDIIILPRGDVRQAPVPPAIPDEFDIAPFGGDLLLQRIHEYRSAAVEHYRQAIAHFSETARMSDIHNPWGRTARLLIGICYLEMGQAELSLIETTHADNAVNQFQSLIATFPESSEIVAAHFLLGEHHRVRGNTDAAFRELAHAFESLRLNPAYASHWLPRDMIVQRSIDMVRQDLEQRNYTDALRMLRLSIGIIPEENRIRLIGELHERWAAMLLSQAETTFGEEGEQLVKEAETQHRRAGYAFAALAQLLSDTTEFSELLWRAAENYRAGKDFPKAVLEYLHFIEANFVGRRPEVNLRLGEMYLHLDALNESLYVLEEALRDHPAHPLVPQIRLVLSYVYREQGEWDKAKTLLKLNLLGEEAPTSGPYRDSMFELGKISFAQRDLNAATAYLEDAVRVHPNAVQTADANYTLGLVYMMQADQLLDELLPDTPSAIIQSAEANARSHRYRAVQFFEQAEAILTDRQQAMGLSMAERLMLRNAHFKTCTLLLKLGQYEQAIPRLNTAATMYQDREEALDALIQMAYAYRMVGRHDESATALRRARVILNHLEKTGAVSDPASWRTVIQTP